MFRNHEDRLIRRSPVFCVHGYVEGDCVQCDQEDDYTNKRGGIDKCLNCGRYMYGDMLTRDQVCATPCRNPNEY